jgi:hypothetical protein
VNHTLQLKVEYCCDEWQEQQEEQEQYNATVER